MTPKVAIIDAGTTFLLGNLDKALYLHYNENNDILITIPAYDYVILLSNKGIE